MINAIYGSNSFILLFIFFPILGYIAVTQETDCWCVISVLCHTPRRTCKALAVWNSMTCLYNIAGGGGGGAYLAKTGVNTILITKQEIFSW